MLKFKMKYVTRFPKLRQSYMAQTKVKGPWKTRLESGVLLHVQPLRPDS